MAIREVFFRNFKSSSWLLTMGRPLGKKDSAPRKKRRTNEEVEEDKKLKAAKPKGKRDWKRDLADTIPTPLTGLAANPALAVFKPISSDIVIAEEKEERQEEKRLKKSRMWH